MSGSDAALYQQQRYAEFLASSGIKQEAIDQIVQARNTTQEEEEVSSAPVVAQDDLLPTKLEEDIDFSERLTDIQIKDGINRLKLLALKVLTYTHVTSGTTLAPIFLQDLSQQEPVQFHLERDEAVEK